jgi:hypothetical protein
MLHLLLTNLVSCLVLPVGQENLASVSVPDRCTKDFNARNSRAKGSRVTGDEIPKESLCRPFSFFFPDSLSSLYFLFYTGFSADTFALLYLKSQLRFLFRPLASPVLLSTRPNGRGLCTISGRTDTIMYTNLSAGLVRGVHALPLC